MRNKQELLKLTKAELEQILYRLGRTADMTKENMVDLIRFLSENEGSNHGTKDD